ncbi:MAG: MATE family efflux transporter [Deltaproteobacteria bacterium]|nr:MATE family efflux transporter [Deltaproteobacteria bacterium]MBW2393522.1 MATE family efflux transporter [Deltaproteobacteria bacterium]
MSEQTGSGARPPSRARSWTSHDHTQGRLLVSLLVLALPLVVTSLAHATFQMVDLAFLSRLGEQATTAVVVTNQSIRQVFFMLAMGGSFGAQALIARAIGEGDQGLAERVTGQVLLLGAGMSVAVALIGLLFAGPLLGAMNVSPAVLELGVPYARLTLLLAFGFLFGMLFHGVLQGAGDTTTPMVISIVQIPITLTAEYVLMFGAGPIPALGVLGVAAGLAIGQAFGLVLMFRVLFSGRSRIHLRPHHLRPDREWLGRILSLSWRPGLQMLGGFIVNVAFLGLMGSFGEKAQSAYSIGLRLGMVGPMIAFPLAGAAATLVGQNLGAGNIPRAWRAIGVGLGVHAPLLWSIALGLFFFGEPLMALFTDDPEVVRLGAEFMTYQAGQFFFFGFSFVFFRTLQGAGDMTVPMAISLGLTLLVTIPGGFYLASDWGLAMGPRGVFVASLVSAGLMTVMNGAYLATGRWTTRRLH